MSRGRKSIADRPLCKTVRTRSVPSVPAGPAHRDLNPITWSWKRLQVDFEMTRFIRLVRDPLAIGRKLAVALLESGLNEWVRRAVCTKQHIPDVRGRTCGPRVEKNASIRRYFRGVDHRSLLQHDLLGRAFGHR